MASLGVQRLAADAFCKRATRPMHRSANAPLVNLGKCRSPFLGKGPSQGQCLGRRVERKGKQGGEHD